MLSRVGADGAAQWRSLGGRSFALGPGRRSPMSEGHLGGWLEARFAVAVIVRPDGYVYGVAGGSGDLDGLIGALADDLKLTPEARAAAMKDSRCSA